MTIQYSATVRNAKLDAIESTVGATPSLILYSGAQPANCAAADPAGVLCTIVLPSDWMNAAATGSKTKLGTWSAAASAGGTAISFRIKQGATCHMQGSVGLGSGDLSLDNNVIANGQTVTISTFTINDNNP
jgi:hypothetical protein